MPGSAVHDDAVEIGRLLASAGVAVVCGGRGGVMEAVALGVAEGGGLCIGLLPGSDPAEGNRHLTTALATGLGEARNSVIVTASAALIAVGGDWGTLNEVALALKLGRPVTWLHGVEFVRDGRPVPGARVASSPGDAVRWALDRLTSSTR